MLIAKNPRRLRLRKRARCKAQVLAKLDELMLRRLPTAPSALPPLR